PVYLFNIAQAFRMARHCRQAQGFYRDFLAASPESRSRAAVEGWIRELEPCAVAEDDAERARLAAEKREREKLEREKRAATPIHRGIDRGRPLRIAGLGTFGVGVVMLGIGTGYTLHSRTVQDRYNQMCGMGCPADMLRSLDADGKTANTRAMIG